MTLIAPAVAPFEWTVDTVRELIRLRRDNHEDFEFVSNNRHERIWRTISNQLFLNRGFAASPFQCHKKWYSLKYEYKNFK
ncbi:5722_t:CDS:1, partial [Funneliformis geosporum]